MSESAICPYLQVQRSAYRTLTPSGAEAVEVHERWICRHPFHGLPLPLGESAAEATQHCVSCPLPRLPSSA